MQDHDLSEGTANHQERERHGEKSGMAEVTADIETGLALTVKVKNSSAAATGEVIQVYVRDMDSVYAPPGGKLCGFARVYLEGGESKEICIRLGRDAFTVVDQEGEDIIDGSHFLISAGLGQPDERTRELTGRAAIVFAVRPEMNR